MPKSVDFEIDHAKRRVIRTVRGDADSDEIGAELLRIIDEHPMSVGYDTVTDWRGYQGKIEWRDLAEFAKAFTVRYARYLEQPDADRRPIRAAFVIEDKMAATLVSAMQQLYRNRTLHVFPDIESALAWLDADAAATGGP